METIDREYLLRLAHEKSSAGRTALAEAIDDLLRESSASITDRERLLMYNILRDVLRDVEMAVRASLAQRLAETRDAPLSLIRMLANDTIEVALPILRQSPLLGDEDLMEVIWHRTLEHQLAVTNRQSLSETVSQALVDTENPEVICSLLDNADACISAKTMAYLVEQSERMDRFREPLLRRRELGPELAKRMYLWVSAVLRQHILDRYTFEQDEFDDLLEAAVLREIENHESKPVGNPSTDKLAKALEDSTGNAPDLLVQTLRAGEISLFLSQFGERTGLRPALVKRIVFAEDGIGLAIVCKALNFGTAYFASLFALSRNRRTTTAETTRAAIRKVMEFYRETPRAAAASVLRRWRRDPRYQAAIRELEAILKTSA